MHVRTNFLIRKQYEIYLYIQREHHCADSKSQADDNSVPKLFIIRFVIFRVIK